MVEPMSRVSRWTGAGALLLLGGCSSMRMSESEHSLMEQRLFARALERATLAVDASRWAGKRASLELASMSPEYDEFAEAYVRTWLETRGVHVVGEGDYPDVRLLVVAPVLAVDRNENFVGTPAFNFLGVPVPAISFYAHVKNRGTVELEWYEFDGDSDVLSGWVAGGSGEAKYDRYTAMIFFSWISKDLDEEPEPREP